MKYSSIGVKLRRKNPYYYYFQRERNYEVIKTNHGTGVVSRPGRLILYQQSLMPFFPSISYSLKF